MQVFVTKVRHDHMFSTVDIGLQGHVEAGGARQLLMAGDAETYLVATSKTVVKESGGFEAESLGAL